MSKLRFKLDKSIKFMLVKRQGLKMKSTSKLCLKFSMLFFLCAVQNISFSQQFNQTFDTKNHPKAKGVWAQVSYPEGWTARETQGANTLQMFTGTHNEVNVQLQFLIRDFGVPIENECPNISESEWDKATSDASLNIVSSNSKKIKVEGKPGFLSDTTRLRRTTNPNTSYAGKQLFVCYKTTRILLTCGTTIPEDNLQKANTNLSKVDSTCNAYFKSIVLK